MSQVLIAVISAIVTLLTRETIAITTRHRRHIRQRDNGTIIENYTHGGVAPTDYGELYVAWRQAVEGIEFMVGQNADLHKRNRQLGTVIGILGTLVVVLVIVVIGVWRSRH